MYTTKFTKAALSAVLVSALGIGSALAQTATPAPGDAGMKSAPTSPTPATPVPDQTAPATGTGSAAMPMDHADAAISPSAGTPAPDASAPATTQDAATADGTKHKKHKKHPS